MEITLGQQYNVREKPTVILFTYINCRAETRKTVKTETETMYYTINMVVIIYYYVGYKYKATTWYLVFKEKSEPAETF